MRLFIFDILLIEFDLFLYNCAEDPTPTEEKKLATWGTDVPDDLVLDDKLLAEALKKVNASLLFIFLIIQCLCFLPSVE